MSPHSAIRRLRGRGTPTCRICVGETSHSLLGRARPHVQREDLKKELPSVGRHIFLWSSPTTSKHTEGNTGCLFPVRDGHFDDKDADEHRVHEAGETRRLLVLHHRSEVDSQMLRHVVNVADADVHDADLRGVQETVDEESRVEKVMRLRERLHRHS